MPMIAVANITLVVLFVLSLLAPNFTAGLVNILMYLVGYLGVNLCMTDLIWLFKITKLNEGIHIGIANIKFRLLDVLSLLISAVLMLVYFLTGMNWILNDVIAVCTILACIKIFKIRSLRIGFTLEMSILLLETIAGLIVHF